MLALNRTIRETQLRLVETHGRVIDTLRAALDALKDLNALILDLLRLTDELTTELQRGRPKTTHGGAGSAAARRPRLS